MRVDNGKRLDGLRCVLVNPHLYPMDLRGEIQTADENDTHENGMNFGVLVVANVLARAGAEVVILDLQAPGAPWQERLRSAMDSGPTRLIGVGTLSVYSFLPLVEILRFARELDPEICTMVGGQNAQNVPMLLDRAACRNLADYVVCGDGEDAVIEIAVAMLENRPASMRGIHASSTAAETVALFTDRVPLDERNSLLDYSLYPNFRRLWPVIEESRGCPYRCDFCANPLQGGAAIRFKAAELLFSEVQHLYATYNCSGELPTVLMTSIYGVRPAIAHRFFQLLRGSELLPKFVASTRVDLRHDEYLDLGATYFDQMHFGLESGSIAAIARMVKTDNAERYLRRASETLALWHDHGIHTGINFIVGYLGETNGSIQESIAWLEQNRGHIDSVWGGGLMAYPDSPFARNFDTAAAVYGASLERVSPFCDQLQTWPVNPSKDLSYADVLAHVEAIHANFFDEDKYYDHYKWYVGPRAGVDQIEFLPREDFHRRFRLRLST